MAALRVRHSLFPGSQSIPGLGPHSSIKPWPEAPRPDVVAGVVNLPSWRSVDVRKDRKSAGAFSAFESERDLLLRTRLLDGANSSLRSLSSSSSLPRTLCNVSTHTERRVLLGARAAGLPTRRREFFQSICSSSSVSSSLSCCSSSCFCLSRRQLGSALGEGWSLRLTSSRLRGRSCGKSTDRMTVTYAPLDWTEGAGGCFAEAWSSSTTTSKVHCDWVEDSAVWWREPSVWTEDSEKPGVSPVCGSKVPKDIQTVGEIREDCVTLRSDFLVVGSGVAGLKYALGVADEGTVIIVTKSEPQECNTNYAQGGISAVFDINDSVEDHIRDTIVAGAYLCDEEAVEVVCREGPEQVLELIEMGAAFDRGEDGVLHLGREGGHSHHRIVHAKDMTGREIERALLSAASKHPNIQIFEHHFAIDFLTRMDGDAIKCQGIDAINTSTGAVVRFLSEVTMLAAGGAGHLYPCTTNPKVATGDGLAMAFRAHTVVSNMEFIQFHPTALADAGLPNPPKSRDNAFLITEAVRGAGGILYNQDGERFMLEYDPRKELAPRDVVARSIDDQLKKRNEKYVFLDISHKPREEILSHFPNIAAECLKYGLDITKDPIPVVPAAHYICGGVQTGLHGETSIDGLYACGEVAHTGLHGANRLASNSLLEALVFSQRAILPSIAYMKSASSQGCDVWEVDSEFWPRPMSWKSMKKSANYTAVMKYTETCRRRLQAIMWDYVGIVRSTERLKIARRELARLERSWEDRLAWYIGYQGNVASVEICEMRNLFVGGKLVVESALKRQESRGLHYTLDFLDVVESERHPTVLVPSASRQLFGAAHV